MASQYHLCIYIAHTLTPLQRHSWNTCYTCGGLVTVRGHMTSTTCPSQGHKLSNKPYTTSYTSGTQLGMKLWKYVCMWDLQTREFSWRGRSSWCAGYGESWARSRVWEPSKNTPGLYNTEVEGLVVTHTNSTSIPMVCVSMCYYLICLDCQGTPQACGPSL